MKTRLKNNNGNAGNFKLNDYANAVGPHPDDFDLAKYNSIINATPPSVSENPTYYSNVYIGGISYAITEAQGLADEYQKQANIFRVRPGVNNQHMFELYLKYRDTAVSVLNELKQKLSSAKKTLSKYKSGLGTTSTLLTIDNIRGVERGSYSTENNILDSGLVKEPTETFFKTATGGYKWVNIGGAVAVAVAVGFGIKFLIKKFTK